MIKKIIKQALYVLVGLNFWVTANLWAQPGRQIYDDSYVHKIEIEFPYPAWRDTLNENIQKGFKIKDKVYAQANIIIDGNKIDSIGVRYKGDVSLHERSNNKGPLKIDFNEFVRKKKYDGIKKFNLHSYLTDPSRLREKLAYDFLRDLGLNSVRVSFTELWVNGDYRGTFNIVEQIDKTYLENNHGTKKGNLYKAGHGATFKIDRDTTGVRRPFPDTSPDFYEYPNDTPFEKNVAWEKKTNEKENDWNDLYDFEKVFSANAQTASFKSDLEAIFDIDRALKILAFNRISQTSDAYFATFGNFFMYNNPNTNKIEWIPWDYNQSFEYPIRASKNERLAYDIFANELVITETTTKPAPAVFQEHLLSNPAIKLLFIENACEVLALFNEERVNKRIDELVNLLEPFVINDPYGTYGYDDFKKNISEPIELRFSSFPGIKTYIKNQNKRVREQLLAIGITCGDFVAPVTLNGPESINLQVDEDYKLSVSISPSNASVSGLSWYSENPEIVEVEQTGDLEAKSEGSTFIVVTSTDGAVSKRIAVSVTDSTLSISRNEFFEQQSISVYPNPVDDLLHVDLIDNSEEVSLKIYNALGVELLQKSVTSANNTITMNLNSIQSSGVYFLQLKRGAKQKTIPFIKK